MTALILSLLLAAGSPLVDSPRLFAAEEHHEGKVVSAGEGKLVIVDDNGENQEFEVSSKTKITRNEKEADIDDIQDGDLVKVTSSRKGTAWLAITIEATAPE